MIRLFSRLPQVLTKQELVDRVTGCRACEGRGFGNNLMVGAPRYGTGPLDAKLMIVGQNPPTDPERGLHGAWLIHYPSKSKGPHELLIAELIERLGLTTKQVYATQVVKCQTRNNEEPHHRIADVCATRHLHCEARDVRPEVIICFGTLAGDTAGNVLPGMIGLRRDVWVNLVVIGATPTERASRYANVVFAPHPSKVGRFVDRESWLTTICELYNQALLVEDKIPGFYHLVDTPEE
jgi:uracil-DNA glycosylase family 4